MNFGPDGPVIIRDHAASSASKIAFKDSFPFQPVQRAFTALKHRFTTASIKRKLMIGQVDVTRSPPSCYITDQDTFDTFLNM